MAEEIDETINMTWSAAMLPGRKVLDLRLVFYHCYSPQRSRSLSCHSQTYNEQGQSQSYS